MGKVYDHKEIEKKQQERWEKSGLYRTEADSVKPKYYVLDMFPYPSGEGLHVGHPRGYIATDVASRKKKMEGYNVLHPMGWDAFGLPAENFAIKNKVHPRVAVEKNIARFKEQLSVIGFNYDWTREINTTDPAFYKWTQWIFLQMFKKGLAYESFEPINWCPSCQTGLANEDVEPDGTCERCGTKVEKKPMRQWVLKITDYADRLLADLDQLPKWPEGVKEAQRNWIGRKEGIKVHHQVEGLDVTLTTFSAYPAWMFADTFIVMAPEHPLVPELLKGMPEEKEALAFIEEVKNTPEIERGAANKEKKGFFTGRYVVDPINKGERMPIWIANFAMMGFGTGIIRCSAHDPRDFEFAHKYSIPLKEVIERSGDSPVNAHDNAGVLKDSGPFSSRSIDQSLIAEMVDWFVTEGYAERAISYRIKDWVFSRQRYWGEPIPIIHCEKCGAVGVPEKDLPVMLPDVAHYEPSGTGESPLATISDWVNVDCPECGGKGKRETNTMPQWAGSSWYYLRYIDPENNAALIDPAKEKEWMPVDVYVGGDHATRHLIYARFWHKFLFDIGAVSSEEPFPRLEFLGFILAEDGRKMSKRWGNIVNPDDVVAQVGADAFRLYEMFIGPFEQQVAWNTSGVVGVRRFLERVYGLAESVDDVSMTKELEILLNQTIQKVSEDIESFKFNTAVSQLMILTNELSNYTPVPKIAYEALLKLLAPFAPHITDEIWESSGHTLSIHEEPWPTYDASKLETDEVTMAVQIAGKLKGTIQVPRGAGEDQVLFMLKEDEKLSKIVPESPSRIVFVPGRIINFIP